MEPIEIWPAFGIQVTTPRLELRAITPELTFPMIELADAGIHDPATMPFLMPWTDMAPPDRQRDSLRFYWNMLATFRPDAFRLMFAVFEDGTLVGTQDALTERFAQLRTFETGSWLGQRHQGRGIGKEMRAAILHLMFEGLGAQRATTGAFFDNERSLGVTRALGYDDNGVRTVLRRGVPAEERLFKMDRATWEASRRDDITIGGLDDHCLAFLGLAPDLSALDATPDARSG